MNEAFCEINMKICKICNNSSNVIMESVQQSAWDMGSLFRLVIAVASIFIVVFFYGPFGSKVKVNDMDKYEVKDAAPRSSNKKKKKYPPGPKGLPYFGMLGQLDTSKLYKTCHAWKYEYGDIVMTKILGIPLVVVNNTELIKKLFTSNSTKSLTNDRPLNFIGQHVLYNYKDVLLRRYDDELKRSKSVMMEALHRTGYRSDSFKAMADKEFQNVVGKFRKHSGKTVDPMDVLMPSFCKMIGMIFTGYYLEDDERLLQCIANIDHYGDTMIQPNVHSKYNSFPWLRHCCGFYGNLYDHVMDERNNLYNILVQEYKNRMKEDKEGSGMVHFLLHRQETDSDWLTDEHINAFLMDLINTSVLTTKSVLSGMIFLWLHRPEVQEKIQEELDHVLGPNREPSVEDLSMTPYTHACIYELLRYQSHLPMTAAHACLSEEVEFEGFTIPKNSVIFGNLYSAHHDKDLWENPWEFRPERFLTDHGTLVPADSPLRTNLLPFGVGPRSCVGQEMAYHRMFLYTAHLLSNFEFRPVKGTSLPSFDPRHLAHAPPVLLPPPFECTVVSR